MARSTDGGQSFSPPLNLSNSMGDSEYPSVAIEENSVIVAWQEVISADNHDVFVSRSEDEGVSFMAPVNLSKNIGLSEHPSVAIVGNSVMVAWEDDITLQHSSILVYRSNDFGKNFSPLTNLPNHHWFALDPSVAIVGRRLIVAWEEGTLQGGFEILFTLL